MKYSKNSNQLVIDNIKVGECYVDPFHFTPKGAAIMVITEVRELSSRFDCVNRVVEYDKFVPVDEEYSSVKFIGKSSIWAGNIEGGRIECPINFIR